MFFMEITQSNIKHIPAFSENESTVFTSIGIISQQDYLINPKKHINTKEIGS